MDGAKSPFTLVPIGAIVAELIFDARRTRVSELAGWIEIAEGANGSGGMNEDGAKGSVLGGGWGSARLDR
jgi:hypothetical protein